MLYFPRKTWGKQFFYWLAAVVQPRGGHRSHPWGLGKSRDRAELPAGPQDVPMACSFAFSPTALTPKSLKGPSAACVGPSGPVPVPAAACPITKLQQRRLPDAEEAPPGTVSSFLAPRLVPQAKTQHGDGSTGLSPSSAPLSQGGCPFLKQHNPLQAGKQQTQRLLV